MTSPKRILVIDDQDDIREIAALSLESGAGWDVLSAQSGRRGIEVAAQERPDAILLDVMMPGMDGRETLAELRKDPRTRDIPVLFLTAKRNVGSSEDAPETAAQGLILKPFDPLTLSDQIAEALGWPKEISEAATAQS